MNESVPLEETSRDIFGAGRYHFLHISVKYRWIVILNDLFWRSRESPKSTYNTYQPGMWPLVMISFQSEVTKSEKLPRNCFYQSRRLRYGFQGVGKSSCYLPLISIIKWKANLSRFPRNKSGRYISWNLPGRQWLHSRNFQSGPIWPRNWSDMAKLVWYTLETGSICLRNCSDMPSKLVWYVYTLNWTLSSARWCRHLRGVLGTDSELTLSNWLSI